jgi:hypothetical protein
MPYITSVERLGIEQGIQRGLEQGMQPGEATLVLRQLNRRLGQVTTSVEKQIRQLSVKQLEDLGEVSLDFENEADLLHWLSQNHDLNPTHLLIVPGKILSKPADPIFRLLLPPCLYSY